MSKDPNQPSDDKPGSRQSVQQDLDATGLYCPEPVMLLHNRIRDMAPGDRLRLVATDPSTIRDVPKFCLYLGHELLESGKQGDRFHYLIQKKDDSND